MKHFSWMFDCLGRVWQLGLLRHGSTLMCRVALPYKPLTAYLRFIEWNESIVIMRKSNSEDFEPSSTQRRLRVLSSACLAVVLCLYHCLILPYHWLVTNDPNHNHHHQRHQVVWADMCTLVGGMPHFNLPLAAMALMVLYFQYRLLWSPNPAMCRLLRLMYDEDPLHAQRNHPFGDIGLSRRARRGCMRRLRLAMVVILNALQVFTIIVDMLILYDYCYVGWYFLYEQPLWLGPQIESARSWSPKIICLALWTLLTWTLLHGLFLLLAYVLIMTASLGLSLVVFIFLRCGAHQTQLGQIEEQQNTIGNFNNFNIALSRWTRAHCRSLRFVAQVNPLFGQVFTVFLAFSYPISAYSIMLIVTGRVRNLVGVLALVAIFGHELFCILVIHFYTAKLSKALHRPAKVLLRLDATSAGASVGAHSQPSHRKRPHLRLTHLVQALHTRRRYGITYGTIGLVTMGSFAKAILFYCETLAYTYKMISTTYIGG